MVDQISKDSDTGILADQIDELLDGEDFRTAFNAVLTVVTWKVVEAAEITKKPVDELLDSLFTELKEAAKQLIEVRKEDAD